MHPGKFRNIHTGEVYEFYYHQPNPKKAAITMCKCLKGMNKDNLPFEVNFETYKKSFLFGSWKEYENMQPHDL